MRIELHPCYILHSRKYRETSLILDTFSAEFGRLSVIAKGGRKEKNNKRALMQPGRPVNMAWTIRREMGTLTAIEPAGPALQLTGRLLMAVFYINELLIKLLHQHEPHAELFSAYEETITALTNDSSEEIVLRIFEKRLLESLGYGLSLTTDSEGNAILDDAYYQYHLETGAVRQQQEPGKVICYTGKSLLALANENLIDDASKRETKMLMRHAISELLGDKKLASRELYKDYLNNRNI